MNTHQFLLNLDALIEAKHLLKTPFYQAWSHGTLSKKCLQEYAKDYYHHIKAFPTYISALHSRTDDPRTRKELLKNLVEEEGHNPTHPDLWRQFCHHLEISSQELDEHLPSQPMQNMIKAFDTLTRHKSIAEGLAALYTYESQIPAVSQSKIEGLKRHYGMHNPAAWHYFTVHIEADVEHAQAERELLASHITPTLMPKTQAASDTILTALNAFLEHLTV